MKTFDLHMHTCLCDGKNTPEEMVLAALEKGLDCIGFSGHSHTAFDESYCLSVEKTRAYQQEIRRLQEKYRGQIKILCGIEQDYYGDLPTEEYDYVIGSVHYVQQGGTWFPVDESAEILKEAVESRYGGDAYAMAEDYFRTVAGVVEATHADIIGHFDLISKFQERLPLFDENHPRYVVAWKAAVDRLVPFGKPFEINTGAISRGYRTSPYPAPEMLRYIFEKGGKVIFSSDSHSVDTLCYEFDVWERMAREIGFADFSFLN